MADGFLKLKWNGHVASFLQIFQSLRNQSKYTDVTIACEGRLYTVHRLVLASCSQFFDHIFEQTPSENTVIVLNEAKACDVEALLDYMYCGEVDVQQSKLASFIRTAKCLQIKGLIDAESDAHYTKEEEVPAPANKKRKTYSGVPPLNLVKSSFSKWAETSAKASVPNLVQNCWVFQQSDLPNTTWSTSHLNLEEGESGEREVGGGRKKSPSPLQHLRYPSNTSSEERNNFFSTKRSNSLMNNPYYDDYEEPLDFKKEVKEEDLDTNCSDFDRSNDPSVDPLDDGSDYHGQFQDDDMVLSSPSVSALPLRGAKKIGISSIHGQATMSPKLIPYAKCSNCHTSNTKLWRRSMTGDIVCNACGLYFKLHGVSRPSHLFRNAPMTRRRNPPKKKKNYEEILDCREVSHSNEDQNEPLYNESGCDSDTQDGLAVLNAALTLNSLFVKAKAQEAAAKKASLSEIQSSEFVSGSNPRNLGSSPAKVRCDSSVTNERRPPLPPLLKIPLHPTRHSALGQSNRDSLSSEQHQPTLNCEGIPPLSDQHSTAELNVEVYKV